MFDPHVSSEIAPSAVPPGLRVFSLVASFAAVGGLLYGLIAVATGVIA